MEQREDLVLWLTEKLAAQREVMLEHHCRIQGSIYEQHLQLIAEVEARLCVNCDREQPSTDIVDEPSLPGPTKNATVEDQAHALDTPTPSADKHYKSDALKSLAGHSLLPSTSWMQRMVNNPTFEAITGIAIVVNTLILACEIEYHGFDSGYDVGYKNFRPSEEVMPGGDVWFGYLDVFFVLFFTIECFWRIGAAGRKCPSSPWIWFDVVIITVSWVSMLIGDELENTLDPTVCRVARLARMLRAFKLTQTLRAFDSLYLLLKSIQASVGALFWSFILLIFVQVSVGLCLSQLLRQYIQNESHDVADRKKVFLYYGTFSRTMVTMFEITLSNWTPSCRVLMNQVSEWFGLFYVLYNCCFIFAAIRVIQAVFIAETNRVVAADDQINIRRKQKEAQVYLDKLNMMFEELDSSGDGFLQRNELQELVDDRLLKTLMSTLGVNVHDLELLYKLLDNGCGEIGIRDFISGLSRVKGTAQSIDLVPVLKASQVLETKCDIMLEMFGCTPSVIESRKKAKEKKSGGILQCSQSGALGVSRDFFFRSDFAGHATANELPHVSKEFDDESSRRTVLL